MQAITRDGHPEWDSSATASDPDTHGLGLATAGINACGERVIASSPTGHHGWKNDQRSSKFDLG
jgi:hypothetical protein